MKKKIVFRMILIVLILVAAIFLYSEKVNKIEVVDNVKNAINGQITVLSEQIQNNGNSMSQAEEPTIIDVTDLEKGEDFEHDHLFKTMYDDNKHWEECTVCREKKDENVHSYKRTWAAGKETCEINNYYTDTCSCGYSIIGHRPCVWDGKSLMTYNNSVSHLPKCKICNGEIADSYYMNSYGNGNLYKTDRENCYKEDGTIIDCKNLGKCVKCGYNYSTVNHVIDAIDGKLVCRLCKNEYGTVNYTITNNSTSPVTYTIVTNYKLTNGATCNQIMELRSLGEPFQTHSTRLTSGRIGGTDITLTSTATFKSTWKTIYGCYAWIKANIDGGVSGITSGNFNLSPDPIKPTISSITMDNQEDLTEWSRTKPIVIQGTENYCNTVTVKILNDEESVVFEGETVVTNGQYSISCTPEIEAGLKGRNFKTIVTDACENTIEQDFIIERIDTVAPTITTPDEVGGEWAKSKNFTFTATDKGVGNVSIAFNNIDDYKLAIRDGENYSREYKFVGDVYNPKTAIVIYKDELGNISTKDIVIDKLDNTAPTITKANLNNNKLTIESNDSHPKLGEGSGVSKYRYIASEEKIENTVVAENWIEVSKENEITIENVNKAKYIYIVAEDTVGNVSATYELEVPDLVLTTEVNLNAANGKGGVDLDWSTYDATNKIFKAYQKKEDSEEWESISTVDFYSKGVEPINVLNIYPESNSNRAIPLVTYKYLDGTSENLPKSASLKVWMEGGTMTESGKITTFNAYGKNPLTGEQIIKVKSVSNADFNNEPTMIWNYDVVMIGTWDGNGLVSPNDNSLKIIEEYIKSGYGVLSGHDTISYCNTDSKFNNMGMMRALRKYFNIELGRIGTFNAEECDYNTDWGYLSNYVTVNKNGLLTNFPYELPVGTKLTIPETHTSHQGALGNIWMTLVNGTDNWNGSGSINNYYNAGGKGNPCYYLTTYNNTAMIQTGHSNGESTDDERKVLANTLFYLMQRTTATSFTDNSSQDLKAPNAPTISSVRENNNIKIGFHSEDNGSKYEFYVEAYDNNDSSLLLATSNKREETVTTGTKGYYYIIDENSENTDFDITAAGVQYTTDKNIIVDLSNNNKYIHMKAEDVAGNVSEPSVIKIDLNDKISIEVTKKWIDNSIQALRRPDNIKFVVTSYEEVTEDAVIANEEIISGENEEVSNEIVSNEESKKEEQTEENSKEQDDNKEAEELETDEETLDLPESNPEENKLSESAYSSELVNSGIVDGKPELVNNLGTENQILSSNEEEQEDITQIDEESSKVEEMEEPKQEETTVEEIKEQTPPEEVKAEDENANIVDTENEILPQGEKVETYVYEFTEKVYKNESEHVYTLAGLPRYNDVTGKKIKYVIKEVEVNPGDLKFYEYAEGVVTEETDKAGNTKYTAEIVNTFKLPKDNIQNVSVIKNWNDNNKISTRPTNIILELVGRVEDVETTIYKNINSQEQSISAENDWRHVFASLPIYDENGQKIEYTLQEKADEGILDKYIAEVSDINDSNEIIITNNLIIQDSNIVKGGDREINSIDSNVSYNLCYDLKLDTKYKENAKIEIVDTLPYQLDEEKSNLKGGVYNYNEETNVATITWRGTYNPQEKNIVWENNTEDDILVDIGENSAIDMQVISIMIEFGVTYKELPVTAEKIVNNVSGQITLANNVTDLVESSLETEVRLIKDVIVNKTWKGDTEKTRPDTIEVQLLANTKDENGEDVEYTLDGIETIKTLSKDTEWTATLWTDLPSYDENGKEIHYTVNELDVDGYKSEIIQIDEDSSKVEITLQNTKWYKLPITGGIGVDTITNLEVLVGIIVLILITNRKKVTPTQRSKVEARKIKNLEKLAKLHNRK